MGFAAFDHRGGNLVPRTVPGTTVLSQEVIGSGPRSDFRLATSAITEISEADPMRVLRDGATVDAATAAELDASVRATYRTEHPDHHNANTIDCASCHWAGRARRMADAVRHFVLTDAPEAYGNARFDLGGATPDVQTLDAMPMPVPFPSPRAFGYLNDRPVVIQRVINESAGVAEALGCAE